MATYLRPGVYVQETLNPIPSVAGTSSQSVAAFIGATYQGPTIPTLVTSWSQYLSLYGGWTTNNTLHYAVLLFFSNGGSQCYVLRVVSPSLSGSTGIATRSFNDRNGSPATTLTIQAANPGAWGNTLSVTITNSVTTGYVNLTVAQTIGTAVTVLEYYTDLSMDSTDNRYIIQVINSQSNYIVAIDNGSSAPLSPTNLRNPVTASNIFLAGGLDYNTGGAMPTASDITNALSKLDIINSSLVLNIPGVTDYVDVNSALSYASNRGDVFVVIDGINDTPANQIALAQQYTATNYGAVYYPPLYIKDPTTSVAGATLTVGNGAAVAGLYMNTDASRGVFKAPAGLQARIAGTIGVAPIKNADLDSLNSAAVPVNAIRYIPGSGVVVMGARTLLPGTVAKYVPVRRTLIYLEKALKDLTQFAIFEPNDAKLWRKVEATVASFLTDFWRQGGLNGSTPSTAFFVKCDAELNPISLVDAGQLNIEIGVALQRPAEFVIIKIGQFDGGATVTVS